MVVFFISLLNESHNTRPLKEIEFLPISVRYLGIMSVWLLCLSVFDSKSVSKGAGRLFSLYFCINMSSVFFIGSLMSPILMHCTARCLSHLVESS